VLPPPVHGSTTDTVDPQPDWEIPDASSLIARWSAWLLGLLVVYVTAASLYQAAQRPFWYDEIFTVALARLDSLASIREALARGTDTSPPGFYVLERSMAVWLDNERIAYRLCSIISVPIVSLSLFAFVRARTDAVAALVAAIVPLMTVLYRGFAVEARPYAAVACAIALALFAWQRASERPSNPLWTAAFGLSLAASVTLHYYAVLAVIPFALAETVRLLWRHQWRGGMWIALVGGALPILFLWPLLSNLRSYYGQHYWAKASVFRAIVSYDEYLSVTTVGTTMGVVLVLSGVLVAYIWKSASAKPHARSIPPEEIVVALGFLWLPWFSLIVTKIAGGGIAARYTIATTLGLSIAAGYLSHWLRRRSSAWVLVCVLSAFAGREALFWAAEIFNRNTIPLNVAAFEELVAKDDTPSLPIVVANGMDYLPLMYAVPPALKARLVALVDMDAARGYTGSDSIELDLELMARYLPLRLYDYDDFVAAHDEFLLYAGQGLGDWWPGHLLGEGLTLRAVGVDGGNTLYHVTRELGQ
jgi:dolichyl-phosphate-mannose-protein mannosyltransferase